MLEMDFVNSSTMARPSSPVSAKSRGVVSGVIYSGMNQSVNR